MEETGEKEDRAESCHDNLGAVYYSMGQFEKSIEHHTESLHLAQSTGPRRGEATTYDHLGLVYEALGQHGEAIINHKRSLKISQKIKALAAWIR